MSVSALDRPLLIEYVSKPISSARRDVIEKVNEILESYHAQGYDLTLRQVYYQFVARGWIPNRDNEYKRLLIEDAVFAVRDAERWVEAVEEQETQRERLRQAFEVSE